MIEIKQVSQLSEAGTRALNEDRVVVNKTSFVFGVFDGASSLNKYQTKDGETGGYIAARIAAKAFEDSSGDLTTTALIANQNIEDNYKLTDVEVASSIDRFGTTVAVAKIEGDTADLLQVADSVIIIIYKDGHTEAPLGYHDHDLNVMRKWRKLADSDATNIRDIVADDIVELRHAANVTYGVVNGDKRMKAFIKNTTIDLLNVKTIILLTDGMYLPKQNPDQDEDWDEYASLYKEGGLRKIYNTVRTLEQDDPQLVKYPRYKMHDDASAVSIDFI